VKPDELPRIAALIAMLGIAACGGGGGGDAGEIRPSPSGRFDPAYGTAGKVTVVSQDGLREMVVGADGSAYLVGTSIARLDANGRLDAAFGDAGRVAVSGSYPLLDEAGNLYVHSLGGIAKIDSGGHLVPAFGTNGRALLGSFGGDPGLDEFWALARGGDGSLYLAGTRRTGGGSDESMAVAKFDRDGRRVASFGTAGVRVIAVGTNRTESARGVTVDREGSVFVAGRAFDYDTRVFTFVVVKMDHEGNFIGDFGAGGAQLGPPCNPDYSAVSALAVDSTGNLLVGSSCTPGGAATIFKLDRRGAVLASFREGGLRPGLFGIGPAGVERPGGVSQLLVASNGEIFAGGSRFEPTRSCGDFALTRLDADGNTVQTFGDGGVVAFDVGNDHVTSIALDGEGRLYGAGTSFVICPVTRPVIPAFIAFRLLL
jgi:hypothetical protein